jgi:catechol 2,3-dioxygenase-like lactoylglutathione lyase family enzyme
VKTRSPGRVTGITAVVDDPAAVAKRLADCFDAPHEGAADGAESAVLWFGGVRVVLEAPGSPARPRGVFALQLACSNADAVRERLGERPCGMRVELRGAAEGEPSRRILIDPSGKAEPVLRDAAAPSSRGGVSLDHVGVASADNEAAVALLCGRVGFPLESEQTDLEYRIPVETFVSNRYGVVQHAREPEPVGGLRVSFVTVGEVDLELLQDLDTTASAARNEGPGTTRGDRSAIARYVASRGPGLHHLAVRVPDIDARLDRLAAAGLSLIDRRGRPGSRRARIAFVHPRALGGLLIHLVER